jgi:hypothetical protein
LLKQNKQNEIEEKTLAHMLAIWKNKTKNKNQHKQKQRITHSSCQKHKNKDDPNSGNDWIMKKKTCINAWNTLTMHEVKWQQRNNEKQKETKGQNMTLGLEKKLCLFPRKWRVYL